MMSSIKVNNYKNALVEVEEVIEHLEDEDYIKIPKNVIDAIRNNKNEEYIFEYDETLDYANWNLMPETKALLYNIFNRYLATSEQREYFKQKEKLEIMKLEQEKSKKYDSNKVFKKEEEVKENNISTDLIEIKEEKWYKKIFNKIKMMLLKK